MFSNEGEERGPGAIIRNKSRQPAEADDLSPVFVAGGAHPHATSRPDGCSTRLKRNIQATETNRQPGRLGRSDFDRPRPIQPKAGRNSYFSVHSHLPNVGDIRWGRPGC